MLVSDPPITKGVQRTQRDRGTSIKKIAGRDGTDRDQADPEHKKNHRHFPG